MIPETSRNTESGVVVAYFANSADAQAALDDLISEGFQSSQIGAAFRSSTSAAAGTALTDTDDVGSKSVRSAIDSSTVGSGPASDTRAVTPAGLSTGSGSIISGAGRPGPIPGSEIPHHRSTSMPVETAASAPTPLPATGSFHEMRDEDSWWQKLKNFFSADSAVEGRRKGIANDTSMNFGTGEGHLATLPDNDYDYSGSAFEGAFSGMGVRQSHARSIIGDLQQGGAIVSVDAPGRLDVAERILERNRGRIRYEAASAATQWSNTPGERVRIFGQLSRSYPNYLTESNAYRSKAS